MQVKVSKIKKPSNANMNFKTGEEPHKIEVIPEYRGNKQIKKIFIDGVRIVSEDDMDTRVWYIESMLRGVTNGQINFFIALGVLLLLIIIIFFILAWK